MNKNFKDYDLKISYKSVGEETISSIVNPLLSVTKEYKRSVGFFSSAALDFISDGIIKLAENGGHIYLATSPKLSEEDIQAIKNGYDRLEIYKNRFQNEFESSIETLDDERLNLLSDLISSRVLDIRIVKKKNGGMYHDKLAVLTDNSDNVLVFQGSNNESYDGYEGNYEKVRVYKSWFDQEGRIQDETDEFESIWKNTNSFLEVYSFNEAVEKSILEVRKKNSFKKKSNVYELRKYQTEAIDSWVNSNYNGFFVMATGTGKTITSLYSIKQLLDKQEVFTVIAVPYIHLISQWTDDIKKILPNCQIIQAYSGNGNWDDNVINAYYYNKLNPEKRNIIVVITIKSLNLSRYNNLIKKIDIEKLLVVDEAHNFGKLIDSEINYEYKLGLSATPWSGKDVDKAQKLLDYFGGLVYSLPIEKAIGKFLVNYEYHPIFVHSNEDEETRFNKLGFAMQKCFDEKGKLIDHDGFIRVYKSRLRLIANVEEKMNSIGTYIDGIKREDHFIVYCSDGKINIDGDDIKNIRNIIQILNSKGFYPSKFTAEESMDERIRLIDEFNEGNISTLVAIKCLDEGINIPSIETALVLSSNDNYREFVQRRGRILRQYEHNGVKKELAHIYDVIVLPSFECLGIAEIELRRFNEYAKVALNKDELYVTLDKLLDDYGLSYENIEFNNEINDKVSIIEEDSLDD